MDWCYQIDVKSADFITLFLLNHFRSYGKMMWLGCYIKWQQGEESYIWKIKKLLESWMGSFLKESGPSYGRMLNIAAETPPPLFAPAEPYEPFEPGPSSGLPDVISSGAKWNREISLHYAACRYCQGRPSYYTSVWYSVIWYLSSIFFRLISGVWRLSILKSLTLLALLTAFLLKGEHVTGFSVVVTSL